MTDSETSSGYFSSYSEASSGFTSRVLNRNENFTSYCAHKDNRSHGPFSNGSGPRKLENLGNTCYFNATIQALAHCRLIMDWVRQNPSQNMFFEKPNGETLFGWRILRLLEELSGDCRVSQCLRNRIRGIFCTRMKHRGRRKKCKFFPKDASSKRSRSSGSGSLATKEAFLSLRAENVSPLINGTGQQDSHEFLRLIYTCITAADVSQVPKFMAQRQRTSFASLIKGETTTQRTCTRCGTFTKIVEPWTDISVPLRADKTLLECLAETFARVHLKGDNAYECSSCRERVNAIQESNPTQLPPVLTLQLQRFAIQGQIVIKVLDCVHIPPNFEVSTSTQQYSYTLFAVVCHVGQSIDCGHYVSYVKNKSDEWFKCNDMIITPISEQRLINDVLAPLSGVDETPYLVLYEITKTGSCDFN